MTQDFLLWSLQRKVVREEEQQEREEKQPPGIRAVSLKDLGGKNASARNGTNNPKLQLLARLWCPHDPGDCASLSGRTDINTSGQVPRLQAVRPKRGVIKKGAATVGLLPFDSSTTFYSPWIRCLLVMSLTLSSPNPSPRRFDSRFIHIPRHSHLCFPWTPPCYELPN